MTTSSSSSERPSTVATDPAAVAVYVAGAGLVGVQVTHFSVGGVGLAYTFDRPIVADVRAITVSWAETVNTSDGTKPFGEPLTRFDGLTVRTEPATGFGARSVALNESIDSEGVDSNAQTFTTLMASAAVDPPAPCSSAITPRSATAHGSINPNSGGLVDHHFEYGITTANGATAVGADLGFLCFFGGHGADRPVVAPMAGLEPGTTSRLRAVADNQMNDPQQGAGQTFITAAAAAVGAIGVTAGRAVLRETSDRHDVATTWHLNDALTRAYGAGTPNADVGEWSVTQQISSSRPSTSHVQVDAKGGVGVKSGGDRMDGVLTTPPAVATSAATGIAIAFRAASSHHLDVAASYGSYSVVTQDRALAAVADAGASSVLPAGRRFGLRLAVAGGEVTGYGDLITSGTALIPLVVSVLPEADSTTVLGCLSPHIDSYDKRRDRGDVITITGHGLGLGATVALGDGSSTPTDWARTGFRARLVDDIEGTLRLTADSDRVAVAVFTEPANRFSVPIRSTTNATMSSVVRVPGPGKNETTGARVTATEMTVKQAREHALRVELNRAGARALAVARIMMVGVRLTSTGGRPVAGSLTVTFHRRAGR